MNANTGTIEGVQPFKPLEAYYAERDENQRLWEQLDAALLMLDGATGELARLGHDQTVRQEFIKRVRRERISRNIAA